MSVVKSILSKLGTRNEPPIRENIPTERDLGLQTLKKKYGEFLECEEREDRDSKLLQLVPLFNKCCGKVDPLKLGTHFEQVFDFAENVAFLFVRHVTQLAQSNSATLFEYFEGTENSPGAGKTLLEAIKLLSQGPETVVNAMMTSNLSSILVRCIHLFLDLPSPYSSTDSSAAIGRKNPLDSRNNLQRLFIGVLNKLLRHDQAVNGLLKFEDLSLLFGAISSPCPSHNKIWRKAAAETLMTICKHNLTDEVVNFIHLKNCIGFCVRNINNLMKTYPPLELTEILVALTCCLKDASEYSQSLIDDFSSGGGYSLLYDFMIMLDSNGEQDARDAQRHIILLTSDLVSCGFNVLNLTTNEPGPFNPGFKMPQPSNGANTVKNKDAFMVLHNAFLKGQTSRIGKAIIEAIICIYKCDQANFFILEPLHTLSAFLECLEEKNHDVQVNVLRLLEFVVVDIGYIPSDALASLSLVLNKEYPRTQCLVLNYIMKFISHKASFKDVYRESGILNILINTLTLLCQEAKENPSTPTVNTSPILSPLPLCSPEGSDGELMFLVVECIRATIEYNDINGRAFSESGGNGCVMSMIHIPSYRSLALRLMTCLILLEDGGVHMGRLLDLLNTSKATDVALKIDILQTVLRVFQLDNSRRALFRDGCGFHYLISVLTSLYDSLGPVRPYLWNAIPRVDVLQLIQLVFTVLTVAMQDNPANKLFFESNIRFDSFSAPLKLLGCFSKGTKDFPTTYVTLESLSPNDMEFEFPPLAPPAVHLSRNSFIYCASEIFRYLRDMALGIPISQSKPLFRPPKSVQATSSTVAESSTPLLSPHNTHIDGGPRKFFSGFLIHPGAVLCMMDLLPTVNFDGVMSQGPITTINYQQLSDIETEKEIDEKLPDVIVNHVVQNIVDDNGDEDMERDTGRKWSLYLQDSVVREIYSIAGSERNQQSLCQVGLPGRLLERCKNPLSDESHPLHGALERTFEKLSYQSLTASDFRNFLRLGNPLSCSINDVSLDKLQDIARTLFPEGESDDSHSLNTSGGSLSPVTRPLSLARIQSLVSMTTPRDGILYGSSSLGASPPFVEFDMSLDGFGCLFLPSIFPQSVSHNSQTGFTTTTGFGSGGERMFPPSNGLTYSTWLSIGDVQPNESHKISLLTLSQCFLTHDKALASYPLLRIYITPQEQFLFVSTQIPLEKRDSTVEDYIHKDDRKEKNLEVGFHCPQLSCSSHGMWHHVVVMIHAKGLRGKAKVSLFINGKPTGAPQKLPYIHPLPSAVASQFVPFPTESSPYIINAHIGTHVDNRNITPMIFRLGPTYLFDEPLSNMPIHRIYQLGPLYYGSFQNPTQDNMSANLVTECLGQQVPEERIVFGLIPDCSNNYTLTELLEKYHYTSYDVVTIARELNLQEKDDVTPVTLISNSGLHLTGPARCIGGIVCGFTGIRTFEPQPLRNLLSAVGGTCVVLGLVAMAVNVDSLYAAMKAMVCIIGNNPRALKEMERTGGFQVLGMLIRSKSRLVNSNILHLVFTLVGTVDSEHESACVRNYIAFKDLLADQSIWRDTSDDIQRSLCQHFYDLLTHSNDQMSNAHSMIICKLIPELLMRLHDMEMADSTAKAMINVINALIGYGPTDEDIRRYGQLLASLLPRENDSETSILLYDMRGGDESEDNDKLRKIADSDKEKIMKKRIRLRNHLFDVLMSHLTTETNQFDLKFANQVFSTLGFDWLMMFMHSYIHIDTVIRSLRMLVLLVSNRELRKKFIQGEIYGGWLHGIRSVLPEYTTEIKKILLFSSSSSDRMDVSLPGHLVLSKLLPSHVYSPQPMLLMIAMLLGVHVTEIPYRVSLTLESLDTVFGIGHNTKTALKTGNYLMIEAVYPILSVVRKLLHQNDASVENPDDQALVLVKFLEGMYHHIPNFKQVVSASHEFIEALAGCLLPPPVSIVSEEEDEEFVVLKESAEFGSSECPITQPRTADFEFRPALLRQDCSAVLNVIKLLRMLCMDGFISCHSSQRSGYLHECPILELVLEAATTANNKLIKAYQTVIMYAVMKHLEVGNEDVVVTLKDIEPFHKSIVGFTVFCKRVVDKLWQGYYVKPTEYVYSFLKNLVEQALLKPKVLPLNELFHCLNRVVLYQLSFAPQNEHEQKDLVDILCLLSSHSHVIFDEMNTDLMFLQCLLYQLLSLVFSENGSTSLPTEGPDQYMPLMASSLLKSGANRLWSKMLELKREPLEQILGIPLPIPPAKGATINILPGKVEVFSIANPAHTKLQNCKDFLNDGSLKKAWHEFSKLEKSASTSADKEVGVSIFRTIKKKPSIISGRDPVMLVEEYVVWQGPQLVICAQKFEDAMERKYRRHLEYKLRFTVSEWARIEHELTRERGLWGPDEPSILDKWMLDFVEGPNRMRKRFCRNYLFYDHYKNLPVTSTLKSNKHQDPTSYHVPLYIARNTLFSPLSILELPFPFPPSHLALSTPRAREGSFSSNTLNSLDEGTARSDLLSSLDNDDPVARALFKMIDEKITEFYQCARLTGLDSIDGMLLFGTTSFYVVEGITHTKEGSVVDIESATEGSYDPVIPFHLHSNLLVTGENKQIRCTKWTYQQIREVHRRRYLLRHCALEVFSNDGQSLFLIFHIIQSDKIYQKLFSLARPSDQEHLLIVDTDMNPESGSNFFSAITGKRSLTQKWENGELSNFSYLMHLNTLAGRSYNDLMQYPVFPWIIADYDSPTLDLNDPKTFRDLSRPMGAQTPKRLDQFIERYKHFEDPMDEIPAKYYYGTHYSSAMSVASFLIRMEPFTHYFVKLQGGHFDLADRMFHSIPEAWKSASETNMADVKELIPEFFYLPEFLSNSNSFDLGTKQNSEELGSVVLPPWSKGCPMEFIRVHREALESDYVSAHLHEWIDLVFGYKQQGKEAEKNHNVFHPLFYEGTIDIDTIEDSMRRNAVISFIHNFGQMPKQLFKRAHRPRKVFTGTTGGAIGNPLTDPTLLGSVVPQVFFKNLVQLLPSKEPVKVIQGEVGQMLLLPSDKQMVVVERRKVLLPPLYNKVFSWGYIDQSTRISLVEGDKVISVYEGIQQGRILCAAVLDEFVLLTAGESTVVYVWRIKATGSKEKSPIQIRLKHTLHGHKASVTSLATSNTYNIIVSGSKDKTCIIWDTNKLLFVRQLTGHQSPLTTVAVNQLNGNIVSCTRNEIRLWSVNGILLASAELTITGNFRILCCAMSEMFEWDMDNVIITGSSDGIVRFWKLHYERNDDQLLERTSSPLGVILPAVSVSNIPSIINTREPDKSCIDDGLCNDLDDSYTAEGMESSDTESSKELDVDADKDDIPKPTVEDMMDQLIKETKQKAKELQEKTGKWRRRLVLSHSLTMHTSFQRQDNASPAAITCISIAKDHRKLFIGDTKGRVFSWSVADSPGGVMEHWILDEAVSSCMKCNTEFTLTERKHHCRDCGKIFCAKCSDYQSEVDHLRITKRVRVCRDCYERIKGRPL